MRRSPVLVLVLGGLLLTGIATVIWFSSVMMERDRVDRAKAGVRRLTNALEAWKIQSDVYPDSLVQILHAQSGKPLLDAEDLLDPWGQPYQFDPSGPRNQEIRPDIWAATPSGELIGNWPAK